MRFDKKEDAERYRQKHSNPNNHQVVRMNTYCPMSEISGSCYVVVEKGPNRNMAKTPC